MAFQSSYCSVRNEVCDVGELILPEKIKNALIVLERYFIMGVGFDFNKVKNNHFFSDALFGDFLRLLKGSLTMSGLVLLKNLPLDAGLIETPTEYINPIIKKSYYSETVLFVLAELLGKVKTYAEEHDGEIIHNVYPVVKNKYIQSGSGSLVDLKYHTEIAFDQDRPDYIILSCLRSGRKKVPTIISGKIKDKFNELSLLEQKVLSRNIFFIKPPSSFLVKDNVYYRSPLVEYENGKQVFRFNFNEDVIYCNDEFAVKTLEKFYALLDKSRLEVYLEPGMGLVIDNNSFLHARSHYKPAYDGGDRWFQRIYVKAVESDLCVR